MRFFGVYAIDGSIGGRGSCIAAVAFPQDGYADFFLDAFHAVYDCNDGAEKPYLTDGGLVVDLCADEITCAKFEAFAHRYDSLVLVNVDYPLYAGIVLVDASCGYLSRLFDLVHRTQVQAISNPRVSWLTCAHDAAMELGGEC